MSKQDTITTNQAADQLAGLANQHGYIFERAGDYRFKVYTNSHKLFSYDIVHDVKGILVEPGAWVAHFFAGATASPQKVWGGSFQDVINFIEPN